MLSMEEINRDAIEALHKIFECEDTDKLITNYNRAKTIVDKAFWGIPIGCKRVDEGTFIAHAHETLSKAASTIFENMTEEVEC